MTEIWAVLEYHDGKLQENSVELLAELAEIARPEQARLCAVLLTAPDTAPPETTLLTRSGVQHLYILEHPLLAYYTGWTYVNALQWLLQGHTPLLIAASATANGRDWMPRLAARMRLPFVPGCLGLDLHNDSLFALRSIYGGRAYAQTRTILHGRPGLATLISGVRGTPTTLQESPDTKLEITRLTPEI